MVLMVMAVMMVVTMEQREKYCTLATVISTFPELAHSDLKIFCVAVAWQLF